MSPQIVAPTGTPALDVAITFLDAAGATVLALPATGYLIASAEPADFRRRRTTEGSAWVHGVEETSSVLEESTYELSVICYGTTWSQARSRASALIAASQQRRWQLRETIDSVAETWQACAADFTRRNARELAWSHAQLVSLVVPIHPVSS